MEFTQAFVDNLVQQIVTFIPNLFLAVVIFLVSLFLAKLAGQAVKKGMELRNLDRELTLLLHRVAYWAVITIGLVIALEQVNFNVASFIAGLGIVGFTLSFAFQDIAKNFISGVLLLLQQPFDIDDAIEVNGIGGVVTDIELRSTAIRTWDGRHVIIPNADVYTSTIINFTQSPKRRLDLSVGVGYDSDLEKVTEITRNALKSIDGIIQTDPEPNIVCDTFADSSINVTIYYWIDTAILGIFEAKDRVVKAIKVAYETEEIDIPYPIQVLRQR